MKYYYIGCEWVNTSNEIVCREFSSLDAAQDHANRHLMGSVHLGLVVQSDSTLTVFKPIKPDMQTIGWIEGTPS